MVVWHHELDTTCRTFVWVTLPAGSPPGIAGSHRVIDDRDLLQEQPLISGLTCELMAANQLACRQLCLLTFAKSTPFSLAYSCPAPPRSLFCMKQNVHGCIRQAWPALVKQLARQLQNPRTLFCAMSSSGMRGMLQSCLLEACPTFKPCGHHITACRARVLHCLLGTCWTMVMSDPAIPKELGKELSSSQCIQQMVQRQLLYSSSQTPTACGVGPNSHPSALMKVVQPQNDVKSLDSRHVQQAHATIQKSWSLWPALFSSGFSPQKTYLAGHNTREHHWL